MRKRALVGFVSFLVVLGGVVLIVGRGDAPERPKRYPVTVPDDPFVAVAKEGLIEDIDYYLAILEEAHADPFRQVTREAFHKKAEAVKKHIRSLESPDVQLVDAYFLLQEVAAFLAAVVFAAIFAHQEMGTTVGQETGGRTLFTSDSIPIVMPNSQLYVWIPVAILDLPGGNADRGFLPDVEVEYMMGDYLSGRDKDLEKVRELISTYLENTVVGEVRGP